MATQNTTGFQVGANVNPFEQAMRRMVSAAKEGQNGVAGALGELATGPLAGLKTVFAGISSMLAGGFMKNAVDDTAQMTESAMDLSRALGISTNEAKATQIAVEDIGASADEFETAAKGMAKRIKDSEVELQRMGLATRDAAGELRPMNDLVADGIKVLGTYREGTDRMLAGQQLFGKGMDASSKLMLYNTQVQEDARATMEEMGLTVGTHAVAAWQDFDAASDKASFGVQGMKKAIGDSLMPVATSLLNMFNALLPAAITVVRGSLSGLTAGFLFVKNGVVVLWETINAMLYSVVEPLRGLYETLGRAMVGDFSGAATAFKAIGKNVGDVWQGSMDRMTEDSRKTAEQVYNLFSRDDEAGSGGGAGAGTRSYVDPKTKEKKQKDEKETSAVPAYEAALTARKVVFEKENTLREFSKQQELAYWKGVLADDEINSKDRTKILLKTSKLELEILRQSAKDKAQIQQLHAEDYKAETLAYVNELEARAAHERDMGTTTQADYLARQAGFNQLRLQAELDFIQQKITAAQADPDANVVALEQLEMQKLEIKRKYRALEMDLNRQQALESTTELRGMFGSIQSGWSASIKGMLNGTKTLGQGLQGMFQAVSDAVVSMLAEMAAKWLIQQALMMVFGKTMAMSTIAEKSAEAGAGGVASMAAAPWPLNMSAPAFGAAMAAAAASFGVVASAAGGYDIPAGLNPLTQLHEQEMVLPREHANVIRGLADGGQGGGGGAGTVVMNITTPNADSFRRSQRQIQRAQEQALARG